MERITIVLQPGLGLNFEAMRPALQVGAAVAIGRGGGVIASIAEGDAIEDKRMATASAAGYIDSVEHYMESAGNLESIVTCLESALIGIESCATEGQNGSATQAMDSLRRIREITAAFLDSSGGRPSPAQEEALKPSIFDVITGTAGQPQEAPQDLPPLAEHLAQVESIGAGLRDEQLRAKQVAEALGILERWVEQAGHTDGYVGVVEIEAVEIVADELRRLLQVTPPVACRDHAEDSVPQGSVVLKPCDFCGGPPVAFVQLASQGFGAAPRLDTYGDDGLSVEAFVFCHECGAQGPMFEDDIFDASDYDQAMAEGVRRWQDRDGRHADIYEANAVEGQNYFPRPEMEVAHE